MSEKKTNNEFGSLDEAIGQALTLPVNRVIPILKANVISYLECKFREVYAVSNDEQIAILDKLWMKLLIGNECEK